MIVRMQNQGHSIIGIRMEMADAQSFFPSDVKTLDLELDHLQIRCDLKTTFWLDQAEISDPRLSAWLEEKFYWRKLPNSPISVEMVRTGDHYRIQIPPGDPSSSVGFGLNV